MNFADRSRAAELRWEFPGIDSDTIYLVCCGWLHSAAVRMQLYILDDFGYCVEDAALTELQMAQAYWFAGNRWSRGDFYGCGC